MQSRRKHICIIFDIRKLSRFPRKIRLNAYTLNIPHLLRLCKDTDKILKIDKLFEKQIAIHTYIVNQNSMKALNFYERAILRELLKQCEKDMLCSSYQQIANEIGGITYQSIKNYLDKFILYGIVTVTNKGTHRQIFKFNQDVIKDIMNE